MEVIMLVLIGIVCSIIIACYTTMCNMDKISTCKHDGEFITNYIKWSHSLFDRIRIQTSYHKNIHTTIYYYIEDIQNFRKIVQITNRGIIDTISKEMNIELHISDNPDPLYDLIMLAKKQQCSIELDYIKPRGHFNRYGKYTITCIVKNIKISYSDKTLTKVIQLVYDDMRSYHKSSIDDTSMM